jgi:carboxyl-terminal processing protease
MHHRRWLLLSVGVALALLALAACGTPEPTLTPVPPTDTPTSPPPTETPQAEPTAAPPAMSRPARYALFNQVWELVRDRYVYPDYGGLDWDLIHEEVSEQVANAASDEAFYALLWEMVARLGDGSSRFLSAPEMEETQAFYESMQIYGGIGIGIREIEEEIVVVRVFAGSPASEAGLRRGDRIVAVDGTPMAELGSIEEVVQAITGEAGTQVLLVVRSADGTEREVAVRRAVIDLLDAMVEAEMLERTPLGRLTIDGFDVEEVPDLVREALDELLRSGTLEGLVVDVRVNAGGFQAAFLDTLALFVDGGSIGQVVKRDDASELIIPEGQSLPALQGVPVVVLIGPYTEAEAELFAAGLQLMGRATLVGLPSAGNAESLVGHDLSDGSMLFLAEGIYQRPDGSLIEGRGVQPDLVVDADWRVFDVADDPQIQAAIEVLRSE